MIEEEIERVEIQNIIDENGCQIVQVAGDNYMPSYAYTIGLFQQYNHPEIICFGLGPDVLETFLNNAKNRIEEGEQFSTEQSYSGFLDKNVNIQYLSVDKNFYKDYLEYATWFYNSEEFPALELVWPDKKGNFPWQKSFDKKLEFIQPLLDRDIDFKFYESRELDVFATTQVLEGAEIKYVIHDEEGDWFFLESEDAENDDIQIVKLEKLIELDPTINSIYYLQYGWEAYREKVGEEWDDQESIWEDEED